MTPSTGTPNDVAHRGTSSLFPRLPPVGWALALGLSLVSFAASPGTAHAYSPIQGGARFELHLNVGHAGTLGIGGRVDIPLVPHGLIQGVRDELALSPGVTAFFKNSVWMWIPLMVQWNFYVHPYWSLLTEFGLAMVADDGLGVHPMLSMGGRYHFNSRNALVMRLNWPLGLQLGLTF